MYNLKLTIEYDGAAYQGWQKQPHHRTVQGIIEEKLSLLMGTQLRLTGASRTDAGVHAQGQVANFLTERRTSPINLMQRLNAFLPEDIAIRNAEYVKEDFNARFSALSKLYRYSINLTKFPLLRDYSWYLKWKIDYDLLPLLAQKMTGSHDMGGFAKNIREKENRNCSIYRSIWILEQDSVVYEIEGDRFLHGLVRGLVGAMIEVARGKISPEQFEETLYTGERKVHFGFAPPQGLTLVKVNY
ncbi:tRNA pseudouridine(38-40) synthase TruA [bacterium]|nr:tRNA pseudouridine(38-40) synthase TruA [bacterium]